MNLDRSNRSRWIAFIVVIVVCFLIAGCTDATYDYLNKKPGAYLLLWYLLALIVSILAVVPLILSLIACAFGLLIDVVVSLVVGHWIMPAFAVVIAMDAEILKFIKSVWVFPA